MPSLTCNPVPLEERMGAVLCRLTLLACGVLAATAGPAFANATVEFLPATNGPPPTGSEIRIKEDGNGGNDVITMTQTGSTLTFTPTGMTLTGSGPGCSAGPVVTCTTLPLSVSVDLGAGN